MTSALVIGPLSLPVSLLTVFAAVGAGWWLGERVARRRALALEPLPYLVLATGLVATRVGELSAATLAERLDALPSLARNDS